MNFKISRLTNDTINKIVSGTIISDVSDILKELLENSCDAGSSKIFVYIEMKALFSIKVVDNGSGIYKDDLINAFLRYNTSKLRHYDELYSINTYGFRGESLFAISKISNLEIISKPFTQSLAWKCFFSHLSKCFLLEPSQGDNGTVVSVNNISASLFKCNGLEEKKDIFANLFYVFKCIVLSNFNVHFIFFKDGNEYINLPKCFDHYSKVKRIELIVGRVFLANAIDFNIEDNDIKFNGFITFSSIKRGISGFKFLFVNNRFIDDKFINIALVRILNLFVKKKVLFNYCLYLFLNQNLIDINLHPKKTEIRFKNASVLYKFLFKNLSKVFLKNKMIFIYNDEKLTYFTPKTLFLDNEKNYFSMNKLLFLEESYVSCNKFLTILDNKFLFFELDKKVFFVNLKNLRIKIILRSCIDQFLKFGMLSSEQICLYKIFNFEKKVFLNKYKQFFVMYGFLFEFFYDGAILLCGVPQVLYNFLVNWYMLLYDLMCFLESSIVSHFSINRFDVDVINIFFKHIYKESKIYKFEVDFFYKELFVIREQDRLWFDKNCFEVSCKKADKFY